MAEQVRLLADPSKMTPADRIRYYLGLPQGYPMNPELILKASARLSERTPAREARPESITDFEDLLVSDVSTAADALRQDERSPHFRGEEARRSIIKHRPYDVTAFAGQEAVEAHLQRSGFRDPGESLQQARQRVARSQDIYAEDRELLRQFWDAQAQEAARSGYTPGPGEPGVQSMPGAPPNPMTQRAREQFYPAGGPPHLRQRLEELRARRQKAARAQVKGQ